VRRAGRTAVFFFQRQVPQLPPFQLLLQQLHDFRLPGDAVARPTPLFLQRFDLAKGRIEACADGPRLQLRIFNAWTLRP